MLSPSGLSSNACYVLSPGYCIVYVKVNPRPKSSEISLFKSHIKFLETSGSISSISPIYNGLPNKCFKKLLLKSI